MSLLVKICGLSTRETLDVALEAGADMVGFVFFPPSPRHLPLEVAAPTVPRLQWWRTSCHRTCHCRQSLLPPWPRRI